MRTEPTEPEGIIGDVWHSLEYHDVIRWLCNALLAPGCGTHIVGRFVSVDSP